MAPVGARPALRLVLSGGPRLGAEPPEEFGEESAAPGGRFPSPRSKSPRGPGGRVRRLCRRCPPFPSAAPTPRKPGRNPPAARGRCPGLRSRWRRLGATPPGGLGRSRRLPGSTRSPPKRSLRGRGEPSRRHRRPCAPFPHAAPAPGKRRAAPRATGRCPGLRSRGADARRHAAGKTQGKSSTPGGDFLRAGAFAPRSRRTLSTTTRTTGRIPVFGMGASDRYGAARLAGDRWPISAAVGRRIGARRRKTQEEPTVAGCRSLPA